MNVRIAQLLTRFIGKGLAVVAGYFGAKLADGQISSIAEPISFGLAALACAAIDIAIHRITGKTEQK